MTSSGQVVAMGLPASGRTTFLAAFWHQVESGELPTAFVATRLQPDREYLTEIRDMWLSYRQIPRTPLGVERSLLMHLRHVSTGADFDLLFPDAAGETFSAQWQGREVSMKYATSIQNAYGILLFVHAQQVVSGQVILPQAVPGESSESQLGDVPRDWDISAAPTQVQLVDLIQNALALSDEQRRLRVAVIVSAWDEVGDGVTPGLWIERRLPLLDQFCRANGRRLAFRVFGVSAIGGSLSERDTLATIASPSARVRVQVESDRLRDITLPLEFIMFEKDDT